MARLSGKGLIVIALVLSFVTSLLVYSYLENLTARTTPKGQPVVVAKTDIQPRTRLTADMLRLAAVPAEYIQPGAVTDIGKAVGVVVREPIVAGEQVTRRSLLIEGKAAGFSGLIPPGKLALTVAVNDVTGVAGLPKPGDYVDVLVTFDTNIIGEHLSEIFLQNIRVLATNRDTEAGPAASGKKEAAPAAKAMTVTLAVSPDEATRLTIAEEKGKIRLALRPYLPDDAVVAARAVRPRDIVDAAAPPAAVDRSPAPAAPAPAAPRGIQLIRGTKAEVVPVN